MEGIMKEKKEILEKLYDDFIKERDSIQEKINECKNKISEVSSHIDNITGIEDSYFKFLKICINFFHRKFLLKAHIPTSKADKLFLTILGT